MATASLTARTISRASCSTCFSLSKGSTSSLQAVIALANLGRSLSRTLNGRSSGVSRALPIRAGGCTVPRTENKLVCSNQTVHTTFLKARRVLVIKHKASHAEDVLVTKCKADSGENCRQWNGVAIPCDSRSQVFRGSQSEAGEVGDRCVVREGS